MPFNTTYTVKYLIKMLDDRFLVRVNNRSLHLSFISNFYTAEHEHTPERIKVKIMNELEERFHLLGTKKDNISIRKVTGIEDKSVYIVEISNRVKVKEVTKHMYNDSICLVSLEMLNKLFISQKAKNNNLHCTTLFIPADEILLSILNREEI